MLSFSACLAENPGVLKIETQRRETGVEFVIFLVPSACPFPDPSPCPGRGQAARRLRLFCNRRDASIVYCRINNLTSDGS